MDSDSESTASSHPLLGFHPDDNDPMDDDEQESSSQGSSTEPVVQTRSGRVVKRPARFTDGVTLVSQSVTLAAAYLVAFSPLPTDL
jgi:hypothetical protein